jgi:hypothetical protein
LRELQEVAVPSLPSDYDAQYVLKHPTPQSQAFKIVEIVHDWCATVGCLFEGAVAAGVARRRLSIVVNLRAASLHETVKPSNSGFHLVPNDLYFDSNAHEVAKPGVAPYIRARCAQVQKDEQATSAYLGVRRWTRTPATLRDRCEIGSSESGPPLLPHAPVRGK